MGWLAGTEQDILDSWKALERGKLGMLVCHGDNLSFGGLSPSIFSDLHILLGYNVLLNTIKKATTLPKGSSIE
jgi:hypothetical protein